MAVQARFTALAVLIAGLASLVAPKLCAAEGSGMIFVSNEKGNSITVLDASLDKVVRTIKATWAVEVNRY